jgi:hypothetical protein
VDAPRMELVWRGARRESLRQGVLGRLNDRADLARLLVAVKVHEYGRGAGLGACGVRPGLVGAQCASGGDACRPVGRAVPTGGVQRCAQRGEGVGCAVVVGAEPGDKLAVSRKGDSTARAARKLSASGKRTLKRCDDRMASSCSVVGG